MAERRPHRPAISAEARATFLAAIRDAWSTTEAATRSGIRRQRFYELAKADESFKAAWDEADECGLDRIRDAIRARAIDGVPSFVLDKNGDEHPTRIFSDRLLERLALRLPELRERQPLELNVRGELELGVGVRLEHDFQEILEGLEQAGLLVRGPAVTGIVPPAKPLELEAGDGGLSEPDGGST